VSENWFDSAPPAEEKKPKKWFDSAVPAGHGEGLLGGPGAELRAPESLTIQAGRGIAEGLGSVAGGAVGMVAPPGAQLATVPLMGAAGAETARLAYNTALRHFGIIPPDPRTGGEQAIETGVNVATQAGLGALGPGVGVLAARGAGKLAGLPFTGIRPQGAAQTAAQGAIQSAESLGIDIGGMAPMVGGPTTRGITELLRWTPTSATRVRGAIDKTVQDIQGSIIKTGEAFAGGRAVQSQEVVGKGLIEGITGRTFPGRSIILNSKGKPSFGQAMVQDSASEIEQGFSKAFNKDDGLPMYSLVGGLQGQRETFSVVPQGNRIVGSPRSTIKAPESIAKNVLPPEIETWTNALEKSGGLFTYDQLRGFRTMLREKKDIPGADSIYQKLYNDTTSDLERAMPAKLLPEWKRYTTNYAEEMRKIELMRKVSDSPRTAEAVTAAMSGAKNGDELLREIRHTIPEDKWGDFVNLQVSKMARATEENLPDPMAFLKTYQGMNADVKREFFTVPGQALPTNQLNRLVNVLEGVKITKEMLNPSGTAKSQYWFSLLGKGQLGAATMLALYDPTVAVAGVTATVGNYYLGKLLTNRDFVRWLGDGVVRKQMTPNGFAAHLTRLSTIAAENAGMRDALTDYLVKVKRAAGLEEQPQ